MTRGGARPTLGAAPWNVLDYHWHRGEFAGNPKPPSHDWEARVSEILQLYVDITDPRLKAWTGKLSLMQKCQAMTQVARKNGHSW
eukprot:8355605-Pyramimonas_sp.AAC.1